MHGDPEDPRTRGNVNHLLRFDSPALAAVFAEEFARLWGDGPGGAPDSRFGLAKESGPVQRVWVGETAVDVLFAPTAVGIPTRAWPGWPSCWNRWSGGWI